MRIIPVIRLEANKILSDDGKFEIDDDILLRLTDIGLVTLHVVDFDGQLCGRFVNIEALKRIRNITSLQLQVEGGLRSISSVRRAISAGADKVVITLHTSLAPEILPALLKTYSANRIIVRIDAYNGIVSLRGWAVVSEYASVDLALQLQRRGIAELILYEASRGGLFGGLNLSLIKKFIENFRGYLIVDGEHMQLSDIELLQKWNISGILVYRAIHQNYTTFASLIEKAGQQQLPDITPTQPPIIQPITKPKLYQLTLQTPLLPPSYILIRGEFLDSLKRYLQAKEKVLFWGEEGVGKTTLLGQLANIAKSHYRVFYKTLSDKITERAFLSYLGTFAHASFVDNKDIYLENILHLLPKLPASLFLDDIDTIANDLEFVGIIKRLLTLKIPIFASCTQPTGFLSDVQFTHVIQVSKLDESEAINFLRSLNLQERDNVLQEIYSKLDGNLLLLRYFAGLIQRFWYEPLGLLQKLPTQAEEIQQYLLTYLYNDMQENVKSFLCLFALLQQPASVITLKLLYEGIDFEEVFEQLVDILGFFKDELERYSMHKSLQRFLIKKISNKFLAYKRLSTVLENIIKEQKKPSIESVFELIHTLYNATKYNEAANLLFELTNTLLELNWIGELEWEFEKFSKQLLDPQVYGELLYYKGLLATKKREYDRARDLYLEVLEYLRDSDYVDLQGKALLQIAHTYYLQQYYQQARKYYELLLSLQDKSLSRNILKEGCEQLIQICKLLQDGEAANYYREKYQSLQ